MDQYELINHYFPQLTNTQRDQFSQLDALYRDWNEKINVISRKDIDNLYLHHVLHSLSIVRLIAFSPESHILDLGTGGGFPGIPLAIMYPQTRFTLIDGTRKKIKVVRDVAEKLNLTNVTAKHLRAEECKQRFDFVVSRGVASLDKLIAWSRPLMKQKHLHALPNGLICLKGGRLKDELNQLESWEYFEVFPLHDFFEEDFFAEKHLLYVQG